MNKKIISISNLLRKRILLIYCLFVSAAFLLICSKSSPLYPMNDWVDVHCFLTLGNGILHGKVPYVDLYEQKGPVLYFIYAIVALFNQKSFGGQYLLEVITFGLFLYYSAKIAQLYLGKSLYVYPIVAVLAGVIGTTKAFAHGGSVEQMCLFLFVYGLYCVLRACHEERSLTFRETLINGIFAGAVFWIKYTMTGFYLGMALFVLVWYLGWLRDWKKLLKTIGYFLLGFCAVTTVVFLYFLINGAVKELFTCYFYNNIFLYPSTDETPLLELVQLRFKAAMDYNEMFPTLIYLGVAYLLVQAKEKPRDLIAFFLCFAGLVIGTYVGQGYVYYGLVLSAFCVFGLVGLASLLRLIRLPEIPQWAKLGVKIIQAALIITVCLLALADAYDKSENTYLMNYDKQDMPQYQFAQRINQVENPTILNFGFLDGGFYYASGTVPNCPFFCTFNVDAPGMWETQYQYIEDGKVDFVITRHYPLEMYHVNHSKYELVQSATMPFEGIDFTYFLYQLKE